MNKVVCRYSPQSEVDLEEIFNTILSDDKPRHAVSFLQEIRERCDTLAHFPLSGVAYRALEKRQVRYVPYQSYVIYYRPLDDGIYVIRVVHSKMNQRKIRGIHLR